VRDLPHIKQPYIICFSSLTELYRLVYERHYWSLRQCVCHYKPIGFLFLIPQTRQRCRDAAAVTDEGG
jgi:hypothetical protein